MLLLRKSFRLGKMSIVSITHAAKETTHSMKPMDIRHDPLISNVLVVFQNGLEILFLELSEPLIGPKYMAIVVLKYIIDFCKFPAL